MNAGHVNVKDRRGRETTEKEEGPESEANWQSSSSVW